MVEHLLVSARRSLIFLRSAVLGGQQALREAGLSEKFASVEAARDTPRVDIPGFQRRQRMGTPALLRTSWHLFTFAMLTGGPGTRDNQRA